MSNGRSYIGGCRLKRRYTGVTSPNVKLGCIVTRTAFNRRPALGVNHELGAIRRPHRMVTILGVLGDSCLSPVGGNGWTYTALDVRPSREAYATHRPFGENMAPVSVVAGDSTVPKRMLLLSFNENTQREVAPPLPALYRKRSPSGAHDSGMCETPSSAFVSRSAARCHPRAARRCPRLLAIRLERDALAVRGPDGKPIVLSSEGQPAHRARPGQIVDPDDLASLPSSVPNAMRLPSGRHARSS